MEAEEAFDLQIEPLSGSQTSAITPPPNWTVDNFEVFHFKVEVHTNPTTKSRALPVLTLHDIGQNSSTFNPLYTHTRRASPELDSSTAHYHLTAPGHEPRAPDAPTDADYSMQGISRAILAVLDRFSLTRVVGIGIGAGANGFLRAAAERPKAFAGLIMISPVMHASSIAERMSGSFGGVLSRSLGLAVSRHMKDALLFRWLSLDTREQIASATSIEAAIDKLNPRNVARFIAAESWRDGITGLIEKIEAKVLLITGKESEIRYHTADLYPSFNPSKTSWLDIHDCGSLVHEEMPERVVEAVKLFLQGLPGYF